MTAEEIYIHNAIEKEKRVMTLNWRGYIQYAGASTAAALSYLLLSYAEPYKSITGDESTVSTVMTIP